MSLNAPPYVGPISDHFDGNVFHNADPVSLPSFSKGVRYFLGTTPGHWDAWRENPPRDEIKPRSQSLRVSFINHATTLIQLDSLNILTDPIYSNRPSPVNWMGPTRKLAPGIPLAELPPIDLVVLSHNHYDHTDLPSLDSLAIAHDPTFVVGLGGSGLLGKIGISKVIELDWGASTRASGVTITGERCRHFSGRGWNDEQKTLWMSYTIEGSAGRIYFAGDTGYGSQFKVARETYGGFDLAILPIGAYNPRWFMETLHLNPSEAVQVHRELGARFSMGIHFGTFRLSEEGQDAPSTELTAAKRHQGIDASAFRTLFPGQAWDIPSSAQRKP
jgi:L-ascorbate metabolism protein UlaG (beta-lactamase superfamily)